MPVYRSPLDREQRSCCSGYFLLTNKPVLAVVNIGEDQLERVDAIAGAGRGRARRPRTRSSACASSSRPRPRSSTSDERAEMLEALGLGEGALPRFLRTAYHLLGLRTFFTTGEKETPGVDLPGRLRRPRSARA